MNALIHAHSGLRYVVLILLIAAISTAYTNWKNNAAADSKIYSFALIATHIQLLIGLVLTMMSPKVNFSMMSDHIYRFFSVEHTFMMLIAIVLITVGRVRSRKVTAGAKHRTILYFYALALIIMLIAIPWPFRNLGAGWF